MFAEFVRETKPIGTSTFDSHFKRKSDAKDVCRLTNPIGVLLLIAQGCQTIVQATLG